MSHVASNRPHQIGRPEISGHGERFMELIAAFPRGFVGVFAGGGQQTQRAAADAQRVLRKQDRGVDALAIEPGAVGAAEVFDPPVTVGLLQNRMDAADVRIGQRNGVVAVSADMQAGLAQRDGMADCVWQEDQDFAHDSTARWRGILRRQGGGRIGGHAVFAGLPPGKTHPAQAAFTGRWLQHQRVSSGLVGVEKLVVGDDDGAAIAHEHADAVGARRRFGAVGASASRGGAGAHGIGTGPVGNEAAVRGPILGHCGFDAGGQVDAFGYSGAHHVVAILGYGHGGEYANDGHDDHQFDQREAVISLNAWPAALAHSLHGVVIHGSRSKLRRVAIAARAAPSPRTRHALHRCTG